jgi:hypothetical protein
VQSVELLTVTDHAAVFQIVQTITSFAWTAFGEPPSCIKKMANRLETLMDIESKLH